MTTKGPGHNVAIVALMTQVTRHSNQRNPGQQPDKSGIENSRNFTCARLVSQAH